ncbi:Cmr2 protein [Martiniozyma asiatica (nom. inval.)]|nr:Cmr2 protein [Martiniozyma asiatica]
MSLDFSIPPNINGETGNLLQQLISEFEDGYITEKGYIKRRQDLLAKSKQESSSTYDNSKHTPKISLPEEVKKPLSSINPSILSGITSASSSGYSDGITDDFYKGTISLDDSNQPSSEAFKWDVEDHVAYNQVDIKKNLQKPLDPRDLAVPTEKNEFDSLAMILRKRATSYELQPAVLALDERGRETKPLTWEKFYFKAEKIAKQIKSKAALYPGDRVCLIYRNVDICDFMIALFGCFLSGTVAVPLNSSTSIKVLVSIMKETQTHLCLMSDAVYKHFEKQQKIAKTNFWPKAMDVWKTSDMGIYKPSKKDGTPPLKISDLAYIDYSKDLSGKWKGVAMSHSTIMHQMRMLSKVLSTSPNIDTPIVRSPIKQSRIRNTIMSTLDPRGSVGMIISVLFSVYSGNLMIWLHPKTAEIPGLFANTISTYRCSILLSVYDTLKKIVFNYQSFPQSTKTFNKKKVDLSCISWCLIDSDRVDCEFNEVLSDRWFKPLGHLNPRRIISPILSLSEHGGAIIAMRDWFGHEDRLGCSFQENKIDSAYDDEFDELHTDTLSEVLIDKESLTNNKVVVVHDGLINCSSAVFSPDSLNSINSKYIRVGGFGYPILDATLALVNPETKFLSGIMEVGEIWVDSHCISGGYWSLREDTEEVFQAECEDYEGVLSVKFVRTGFLGFIYNGKVYVLGLIEDRISQRVTWLDQYKAFKKLEDKKSKSETVVSLNSNELIEGNDGGNISSKGTNSSQNDNDIDQKGEIDLNVSALNSYHYKYHFSSYLNKALIRYIPTVKASAFFNLIVNKEYVTFAVIEVDSKNNELMTNSQKFQKEIKLNVTCGEVFTLLEDYYDLRLFSVVVVENGSLSRTLKSGKMEIANNLTKKRFLEGELRSIYVSFRPSNSTGMIFHNDDYEGGVWSKYSSNIRKQILSYADFQSSGLDLREKCIDDRTNKKLSDFQTPFQLLEWRTLKQPDELAFAQIEGPMIKEHKQLTTWKKFEGKVLTICSYITEKKDLKSGDAVILIYPLSEDFIVCLFACWLAGLVVIVLPPFSKELKYLEEDVKSFLAVVKKYSVKAIFVNNETENSIKNKPVASKIKELVGNINIPKTRNTSKHSKNIIGGRGMYKKMERYRALNNGSRLNCDMIWLDWDCDYKCNAVKVKFDKLLSQCLDIKETLQMKSTSPLLACGSYTSGFGFLQAALLGVYLGTPTYLMTPQQFGQFPNIYFQALSRYKIENVMITAKMVKYSLKKNSIVNLDMSHSRNIMICWDGRPNYSVVNIFKEKFSMLNAPNGIVSNIFNDCYHSLISTDAYLNFENLPLYLDPLGLAKGYVSLVNASDSPYAVRISDFGIVGVNTEVAIVNPETNERCRIGEVGEIWIFGKSVLPGGTIGKLNFNEESSEYYRSGQLGFLHVVKKQSTEMSLLYVLGKISETFEVAGLQYFVQDIEAAVEEFVGVKHALIFVIDGLVVLIAETDTKRTLSNICSMIVLKILNKFKLTLDVVTFVSNATLPLSRTGELQRGKIIKQWIKNKLEKIGEFGVGGGEKDLIEKVKMLEWTEQHF